MNAQDKAELRERYDEFANYHNRGSFISKDDRIFDFFLSIIESDREKIQALTERLEKAKTFFKVVILYDANTDQGRSVWKEMVQIFDAADSNELHQKISDFKRNELKEFLRYHFPETKEITKL